MKNHLRLLVALMIALSGLLAIQPAGAHTASAPATLNQLCGVTGPLPENFPTWLEVQLRADHTCAFVDADVDLLATGTAVDICSQIGPTVFNLGLGAGPASAVMMNVPACLSPDVTGSDDLVETNVVRVPIEGSIIAMNETSVFEASVAITGGVNEESLVQVPTEVYIMTVRDLPVAAVGDDTNVAQVPTEVYIMTVRDQPVAAVGDETNVAQVPIEVYIMTVRDQPVAAVDDEAASSDAGDPDQLRGRPSNIGPTI